MYFEHENPFSSMPNLRTERLLLRKLNMHDAQDVYDFPAIRSSPSMCCGTRIAMWRRAKAISAI